MSQSSTENLRALHLLWDGGLGGVQRYVLKVMSAPYWKNVTHGICFFSAPGEVLAQKTFPAAQFWSLGLKRGWDLWGARRLDAVVREFNPQVIHCHCDTPALGLRIKNFTGRRLIYTEHGDTLMRSERSWFMRRVWRLSGECWNAILLNSEFVKRDFLRRFPWLIAKCRVFPNPLIEQWNGPRTAPKAGEAPRIGVFGRLVKQKGMDWMLNVARLASAEIPNLRVEFFGDGPLRAVLEAKRKQLGLRDHVCFHGYVNDPLARMAQMTCVVVPSRIEPFGLVALEAQGAGVPVIGFTESGVAEIVVDGQTGWIVPHGGITAMARAIVELVKHPETGDRMGISAKARAKSVFGLEEHVKKLAHIYRGA